MKNAMKRGPVVTIENVAARRFNRLISYHEGIWYNDIYAKKDREFIICMKGELFNDTSNCRANRCRYYR